MGRRGLLAAALVGAVSLTLVLSPLFRSLRSERRAALSSGMQPRSSSPGAASGDAVDPNLPLVVAETRRLAARAIDDTAAAAHQQALVALARIFLGTPAASGPVGSRSNERLVLDLTSFDALSFVEQLLALSNSRQVRSRTEAVDRFSDHVRRLRYGAGRVDRCPRLRPPPLWALAAARRGYLVDLTPFLPGARQRQVPLRDLIAPPPASTTSATAWPADCGLPRAAVLTLAYLPLGAVPAALPSLRSGDLFVLVTRGPEPQAAGIGVLDLERGGVAAVLVQPGRGVVREPDLLTLASQHPDTIGISVLRPLPNADGLPDR